MPGAAGHYSIPIYVQILKRGFSKELNYVFLINITVIYCYLSSNGIFEITKNEKMSPNPSGKIVVEKRTEAVRGRVGKLSTLLPDAAARGLPKCWGLWDVTLAGFTQGLLTMAAMVVLVTEGQSTHAVAGLAPCCLEAHGAPT